MNDNSLVKLFGWRAALVHGDTLVLDRWRFLKGFLPKVKDTHERVLEVGCGTGALTMGIASRGYEAIGLSWDERNQKVAEERARLAGVKNISFPIGDARKLDQHEEFQQAFDLVICFEVIEHILDDRKLMRDLHACLKPGGRLLLTTPNIYYRSSWNDAGPWSKVEDGGHVRRGYSSAMIRELCKDAGFMVEEIGYVSFFFSQVISRVLRRLLPVVGKRPAWAIVLPLRILPPLLDGWLGRLMSTAFGWPGYSITLVAYRKRWLGNGD